MANSERLIVNVEGQTEERFVNEVLSPHLYGFGYASVTARIMGNPRRTSRGGVPGWPAARRDFLIRIKQDPALWQTTLVDYYPMPADGSEAWPGRRQARGASATEKAEIVQHSILRDLQAEINQTLPDLRELRFIPFVVMHEFEGLLFSEPIALARAVHNPSMSGALTEIRQQFACPEDINDSPETSPSKRLLKLFPRYDKVLMGVNAAVDIGLQRIRSECPHFDAWLSQLERIPAERVS